jgi:hypothetical protein
MIGTTTDPERTYRRAVHEALVLAVRLASRAGTLDEALRVLALAQFEASAHRLRMRPEEPMDGLLDAIEAAVAKEKAGMVRGETADKSDVEYPADRAIRMARRLAGKGGEMLRLYLGVDGDGRMDLAAIASRYGVTRERVRQMTGEARRLVRIAMGGEVDDRAIDAMIVAGHMREIRESDGPGGGR